MPCPTPLGGLLESGRREWAAPTSVIVACLGLRPGLRVREVGVGIGYLTIAVARRLGLTDHLIALELQPAMARRARARVDAGGPPPGEICEGAMTSAPLEPENDDLALLIIGPGISLIRQRRWPTWPQR